MLRTIGSLLLIAICVSGDKPTSDVVYGTPGHHHPLPPAATPGPAPVYLPPATTSSPAPIYVAPVATPVPSVAVYSESTTPKTAAEVYPKHTHFYSEVPAPNDYHYSDYHIGEQHKEDSVYDSMVSMVSSMNIFNFNFKTIILIGVAVIFVVFVPILLGFLGLSAISSELVTFISNIILGGTLRSYDAIPYEELMQIATQIYQAFNWLMIKNINANKKARFLFK